MTLLYNLIMAVVDLAVLSFLLRKKNKRVWCAGVVCGGAVALELAIALGEEHFGIIRLACYGLFLHGVLVLAGSAIVLWRARRMTAVGSATMAVLLLAVVVDAFLIEPTWLEVTHRRIATGKLDRPIRIVVLADLQTDRIGRYEREVLLRALQEKPDVILLAGDYIQAPWKEGWYVRRELNTLLREINFSAPRGVFAVQGNIDSPGWARTFDGLDVTTVNRTNTFDLGDLRLTCLGLYESYDPTLKIPNDNPDQLHLVIGHVPNFALGRVEADLLVAGHTHGGQVRLPILGPLTSHCEIPSRWAAGLTNLPGGGQLLVSRGIGLEREYAPRLRFLCRPELLVIDLIPQGGP